MGLRRKLALAAVPYGIHTEDWDEALSFFDRTAPSAIKVAKLPLETLTNLGHSL